MRLRAASRSADFFPASFFAVGELYPEDFNIRAAFGRVLPGSAPSRRVVGVERCGALGDGAALVTGGWRGDGAP